MDDKIWKDIRRKRPVLGEIIDRHGQRPLLDYLSSQLQNRIKLKPDLKQEFIEAVFAKVTRLLGQTVAVSVGNQLRQSYYVSTADHHGPFCHPFFLCSDILGALAHPTRENYIVLATSNISLNNSSYPRGLQLHAPKDAFPFLRTFAFFPLKDRHHPVFNLPGFKAPQARKLKDYLFGLLGGSLPGQVIEGVGGIYSQPDVLKEEFYSDQISKTNFSLWKQLFGGHGMAGNLIYLNLEEIVLDLLGRHHLAQETEIHQLIFKARYRDQAAEVFEGVPSAFSQKGGKGSFLFWGYDGRRGLRMRLVKVGDSLQSEDGSFNVRLEPASLAKAIAKRELIPSNLLCLLTIACYYGVKCLGGFSQTTYLSQMSEAYNHIFPGQSRAGDTKTLCGDLIFGNLASAQSPRQAAATGLDLALYGDESAFSRFMKLAKTRTLKSTLDLVAPYLHKILYPAESKQPWPTDAYNKNFEINQGVIEPIIEL